MDNSAGWLFTNTPVGTILRKRPMALALFEGTGIDPWPVETRPLGEVLRTHGLSVEEFAQALRDLPRPPSDSAWTALPIHHLLDHLADSHRVFLHHTLPTLGRALTEDLGGDADSLQALGRLAAEWPAFSASLAAHIREEEDVLFRRVLRNHTCLLQGDSFAETDTASVHDFGALRLLAHGHRDLELLGAFLEKVLPDMPGIRRESSSLETRLRPLLDEFRRQLAAHARLETEVLLPMALAMERALQGRSLRGEGRLVADHAALFRDIAGRETAASR